jgi:hypothetical protein
MLPLLSALALPAVTHAGLAAEPPQPQATASPAAASPAAASPHARTTWQQRFAKANVAGDGHLTLDEAKDGFPLVAKHFANIDIDGKGFVTESDLRTWYAMRKVARGLRALPDEPTRSRNPGDRAEPGDQPGASPARARVTASAEQ